MANARLSKFKYGIFPNDGQTYVAVSKQKYTFDEAVAIASRELGIDYSDSYSFAYNEAWVMHRAGVNKDGEKVVGWWIENKPRPNRCCPCWIFPAQLYDDFISVGNVGKCHKEANDG